MFFRAVLLGALIVLTGCVETVEVRDGLLPDSALSLAASFAGRYSVVWGDRSTEIDFSLNGNRINLVQKSDLLGEDCGSQIGDLKRFITENQEIRRVTFKFFAGKCSGTVMGTELEFDFLENKPVKIALLKRMELADRCDYWHPPSEITSEISQRDKKPPSYGCRVEPIPFYLQGTVVRIP